LANWVFNFYAKKYVTKEYRLDFALALGTKDLSYMKRLYEELNIPGFLLDGALDLCRVSLKAEKPGEVLDFSYPCQTMYELVGDHPT
jgi:3-hydroxyisobutyrate dehydrogenase-like beta-hydroxyacid dehydrogenase